MACDDCAALKEQRDAAEREAEQMAADLVSSRGSRDCGHPIHCSYRNGRPTEVCGWCQALAAKEAAERERDLLHDKWKQMEAYGFDSPSHVFTRLESAERERKDLNEISQRYRLEIVKAQEAMERFGLREHKFTVAGAIESLGLAKERADAHVCLDPQHPDCVVLLKTAADALSKEIVRLRAAKARAEEALQLAHVQGCYCRGFSREVGGPGEIVDPACAALRAAAKGEGT